MANATKSRITNETPNLHTFISANKTLKNREFIPMFGQFINSLKDENVYTYCREVLSAQGKEVLIKDDVTLQPRKMLMFASNNYLGAANHPYVKEKVKAAIDRYGVGLGGPPLLNGYTKLMAELEERLAHLKHQEAAMVFSSGYAANLGMMVALTQSNDHVLYDELSHASFYDGLRMSQVPETKFNHNDLTDLENKLAQLAKTTEDTVFVGVEGVYSMDGDLAPLDKIVPLVKKYNAFLMLDDAHGTGVLGKSGSGTAEHFGVEHEIDISMGTFSKSFAMTGGFLAGSKELINYMRFFARSYMFSAALPPSVLAAVLAGIDIIETKPELRENLLHNARYAIEKLRPYGIYANTESAIIALQVPDWMDVRKANYFIHERGIFLNAIEYPAVPEGQERFRISVTTEHTFADIDRLVNVIDETWHSPLVKKE